MPDLEQERRRLERAELLIIENEKRATGQLLRAAKLEASGREAEAEWQLLKLYEGAIYAFYRHRALILDAIDRTG